MKLIKTTSTNKQTEKSEYLHTLYFIIIHIILPKFGGPLFIKGLQYDVLRFLWYFLILQMKKGRLRIKIVAETENYYYYLTTIIVS